MLNQNEKKETFTFKVEASTAIRFRELLDKEDITISQALRKFMRRYVALKNNLVTTDDSSSK